MRVLLIVFSFVTLGQCGSLYGDITDENWVNTVVESHYPQELIDSFSNSLPGETLNKQFDWVVGEFGSPGVPIIAAVYSDSFDGALRLIDEQGFVIYDPGTDIPDLKGRNPFVEAHDLNGDGVPELQVTMQGGISRTAPGIAWIYSWDGQALNVISPNDGVESQLFNASYFDVDGDGGIDIVARDPADGISPRRIVYEIDNGLVVEKSDLSIHELVVSREGEPGVLALNFSVEDPSLPYTVTFLNGDGDDTKRALDAALQLNGVQILQPGDINPGVETLTRPVFLQQNNQGFLVAFGDPEAHLAISIGTLTGSAPTLPETVSLVATDDTFLRKGSKNRNEGANPRLVVRSSGHNRSLVSFDLDAGFDLSVVETATLKLTIAENSNNWGLNDDRPVGVHSLDDFSQADINDPVWVESTVLANYPQSLVDSFPVIDPEGIFTPIYKFVVDDFDQSGAQLIAAVYSNFHTVELRIINDQGTVIHTPTSLPIMSGFSINVSTLDFDLDGKPELLLSLWGGGTAKAPSAEYVFSWQNQQLVLISPVNGNKTALLNSSFQDIDGNGTIEILTDKFESSGEVSIVSYHAENGAFKKTATFSLYEYIISRDSEPAVRQVDFPVDDPTIPYLLTIQNGEADGSFRAIDATVQINQVPIIQPGEVNPSVATLTRTVNLSGSNQVFLAAVGDPEAHLIISIGVPESGPPQVSENVTLVATDDTFLRKGSKNRNEGANPRLVVRSSGHNRSLVSFDLDAGFDLSVVETATLKLTIAENSNNWGLNDDRPVGVHSLDDFSQGNGQGLGVPGSQSTRGTGVGSTWRCAEDLDISDKQPDCASEWGGGTFNATATDSVIHLNGLTGVVEFDVTSDVTQGVSAWLIKKDNESQPGRVNYYSSEGALAVGDETLSPTLEITVTGGVDPCLENPELCEPPPCEDDPEGCF